MKISGMFALNVCVCGLVAAMAVGCGEVEQALEPSRETRVEAIAEEACERAKECGEVGPDKSYETEDECQADMESRFYELWPEAECNRNQINDARYDTCVQRAQTFSCDGTGAFLDTLAFGQACDSDEVCIDEPEN